MFQEWLKDYEKLREENNMSEEEREILQGLDDMKHLEINPEYKVKIINGILDLYNKEKLNSLNLSKQLNKEKEKNKKLEDKIKEKIIYLQSLEFEDKLVSQWIANAATIRILQGLEE